MLSSSSLVSLISLISSFNSSDFKLDCLFEESIFVLKRFFNSFMMIFLDLYFELSLMFVIESPMVETFSKIFDFFRCVGI
jgi:hypothetical protein